MSELAGALRTQKFSRRAFVAAVGASAAALAAGCEPLRPTPHSSPSTTESKGASSPASAEPFILDITDMQTKTPLPAAVEAARLAVGRLTVDNNKGSRNGLSAVYLGNGLFTSDEHFRRRRDNSVALTRYLAQIGMRNTGGAWVTMKADEVAFREDGVSDIALFRVNNVPSGLAVARIADPAAQRVGQTLHAANFQPAPGANRLAPVGTAMNQAIYKTTLLTNIGLTFKLLAGIGASEGVFSANRGAEGGSGGGFFNEAGELVGTHILGNDTTIGEVRDEWEIAQVVSNGQVVPDATPVEVLTCQGLDPLTMGNLEENLRPIPAP